MLCIREAGKTIPDAIAEVREAVDYCRYYASRVRQDFAAPERLTGTDGREQRTVAARSRRVRVHQPVELPAGYFRGTGERGAGSGQRGARQTGGADAVDRGPRRGTLPPGRCTEGGLAAHARTGETVGASIVGDPRIAGVAFTGSVETAHAINRTLAGRAGPIAPLIAETGGLNAMIVDSTALPEQVVADVIASAFQSTGQRCSSLRLLCLQEEIAGRVIELLAGAMSELRIGDPSRPETDLGPVIDSQARRALTTHREMLRRTARPILELALPADCENGDFFAPCAYEIDLAQVPRNEVFGPILHVIRYRREDLDRVLDAIGGTGFGLTLGIHSRIARFAEDVRAGCRSGTLMSTAT